MAIRAHLESGINFGISAALRGKATVAEGRIQQSNFHDVRVMRINEGPATESHIVASRGAPGGPVCIERWRTSGRPARLGVLFSLSRILGSS